MILLSILAGAICAQAAGFDFEFDGRVPLNQITIGFSRGDVQDPPGKEGLSALTAEMVLRGTKIRSKEQWELALDRLAVDLRTEITHEFVLFHAVALRDSLNDFLKLMSEALTQPALTEGELRKLRLGFETANRNELSQDLLLAERRFHQFLFSEQIWGRPIRGVSDSLKRIQREDIRSQFPRIFRADRLIVLGSGDGDSNVLMNWVDRELKPSLPSSTADALARQKAASPTKTAKGGRRFLWIDKPGRTQAQVIIGFPAPSIRDQSFPLLELGNAAYGGKTFVSALRKKLLEKIGWSFGAQSRFTPAGQPLSWQLSLSPSIEELPKALELALNSIEQLTTRGLTKESFDLAQTNLLKSGGFVSNTAQKRLGNRLLELHWNLPRGHFQERAQRYKASTLEDVNTALKRHFGNKELLIVVVGSKENYRGKLEGFEIIPHTQE